MLRCLSPTYSRPSGVLNMQDKEKMQKGRIHFVVTNFRCLLEKKKKKALKCWFVKAVTMLHCTFIQTYDTTSIYKPCFIKSKS